MEGIPIKTRETQESRSVFSQNYNSLTKGAIFVPLFFVIASLLFAFIDHQLVGPLGAMRQPIYIFLTVILIFLEVYGIGFTIANYKYLSKKGIYPRHRKMWLVSVFTYEAIILTAMLFISIRWGAL